MKCNPTNSSSLVPPPESEPEPVKVGVAAEPVDGRMLDDPDGLLMSQLSVVVCFAPPSKPFPSPIRMSMH